MSTKITVRVSAETLSDARTKQGANFEPGIRMLLADGGTVEIETTQDTITFNNPDAFSLWFKNYAGRLASLHRRLEAEGAKGDDWSAARHLEDAIGAGHASSKQIETAEALLAKYKE